MNKKPWDNGLLQVSKNKKYLLNGKEPFFWLGDTAWLLFERLSEEEAYVYLKNRKEKGFNVIQAVITFYWPVANKMQEEPFKDNDFNKINVESSYWKRVKKIVDIAEEMGIYMAVLPAWGRHVKQNILNLNNADHYLDFLIDLFKNNQNIIWILGGDIKGEVNLPLYNEMGNHLKEKSPHCLVGFHPFGRTDSSQWFKDATWLDFHMFQSGHRRYDQGTLGSWDDNTSKDYGFLEDNYKFVRNDLKLENLKPVIDGEPAYEQILQGLHDSTQPYWESWDARRYAYWSTFAGAFGHTYGANAVMQFYEEGYEGRYGVKEPWYKEMNYIGSSCMIHLKKLMESVDFTNGSSHPELIISGQGEKHNYISVFSSSNFVFCYDYSGKSFVLNVDKFIDADIFWMDPITGVKNYIGKVDSENFAAIPPIKGEGHNDWVLVIVR